MSGPTPASDQPVSPPRCLPSSWPTDDFVEKYEGLIFDCDGTLSDSMPLHFIAWRDTMRRHGVEFTEPRFYEMGGMPSEKIIQTLCGEQGVELDPFPVADEKEAAFEALMPRLEPLSLVCDVANRHRNRMPMAVASGGIRPIVERQLAQLDIAEWFSATVTSEDTEAHKPEPDVFLLAAERLGVRPERCLVFEDSPLGFAAATSAGMDWVDVREATSR